MAGLVMHTTETAAWHGLVIQAQAEAGWTLDEELERYLVLLLLRFSAGDQDAVRIPSDHAAMWGGRRLQSLGDNCLIFAGLFPDQVRVQELPLSYFVEVGRNAYGNLASVGGGELFGRLHDQFVGLMDVLQRLRAIGEGGQCLDLLSAYDLWQATGSRNAWRVLTESTGAIPGVTQAAAPH